MANPAPMTIAAMFILSGALVRTGAIDAILGLVTRGAQDAASPDGGGRVRRGSDRPAFMNNTPVVIIMIPVIKRMARRCRWRPRAC